jgi:hypothetical protein
MYQDRSNNFYPYVNGRNNVGTYNFYSRIETDGQLQIAGYATGGSTSKVFEITLNNIPEQTWTHVLVSINLSNTANRYIYLNDVNYTSSASFGAYSNANISFSEAFAHTVGNRWIFNSTDQFAKGRLSNVFLDYTYRDLSVTNNRRLFITQDGKPADGQAGLNPIMYMPLDDPEDIGYNAGTGGDFTVNGVMARSGRGPNQYNAAASTFDGSADYLSRSSSLSGSTASKTLSGSVNLKFNSGVTNTPVIDITDSSNVNGNGRMYFRVLNGELNVFGSNASGTTILSISTSGAGLVSNKFYNISFSVNLANAAQRFLAIDGVNQSLSVTTYTDDSVDIASNRQLVGGFAAGSSLWGGEMSDLYLDDSYIDLSSDNPFYDTETDKPKYLGASGELPTGSAPLIYLPLYANDAGNNLGTGGDFTVTSGPYTGARGPSETITRTATFNGTSNYLTRGNTLSNSSAVTMAFVFRPGTTTEQQEIFTINAAGGSDYFRAKYWYNSGIGVGPRISFTGYNSSAVTSMEVVTSNSSQYNPGKWMVVLFSVNGSTGSTRLYVNGVSASLGTNYNNGQVLAMNQNNTNIGAKRNSGNLAYSEFFQGELGALYVNSGTYIDFSQEANRLKFVDALGYPTDWSMLIEDGTIATPEVFVPLSNSSNFGENLGTGGDFTVANTPTVGPDASF